jgi:hypothetical protein
MGERLPREQRCVTWPRVGSRAHDFVPPRRPRLVDKGGVRANSRRILPGAAAVRAHRCGSDPRGRPRVRACRHPGRADPHADDQPARRPAGGAGRRGGPGPVGARRPRGHVGLRRGRRPHRGRGGPPGRGGGRRRADRLVHQHRPGGAGARAGPPGRRVGLRLRRRPVRGARRGQDRPAHGALGAAAGRRRRRARAVLVHARQGAQVLRRHRRHPHPPAAGAHPPGVHRAHRRPDHRRLREHADPRASPAPAGTGAASSPGFPSCCARRRRPRRSSPAATTWSSTRPTSS